MDSRIAEGRISVMMRYLVCRILGKAFVPSGVRTGKSVHIGQDVKFDWSNNGRLITIEDEVTIVSGTKIICHDASSFRRIRATWVAPVKICSRAYIGANTVILPGVKIGEDAIVGAGAVVTHDVPSGAIVAGVPAQIIGRTSDLDNRRLSEMKVKRVFDFSEYGDPILRREGSDLLFHVAESEGGYFISESSRVGKMGSMDDL